MTDTEKLLAERAKTHGEYAEHARITQAIMDLIMGSRNWGRLTPIQRESLHMFAHKIGRICEGDPDHHDHWNDISGYAVLVSQRLPNRRVTPNPVPVPVHVFGESPPAAGVGYNSGNTEAHDYEGVTLSAGARPVPVEDSNRHADRAPRRRTGVNSYEYMQLTPDERKGYKWSEDRQEYLPQ